MRSASGVADPEPVAGSARGRRLGLALVSLGLLLGVAEIVAARLGWGPPENGLIYLGDEELIFVIAPDQAVVAGTDDAQTGEVRHPIHIDAHGRRVSGAAGGDPGPVGRRIVVLGDSLTFGPGVTDEQTYAARLAAELVAEEGAPVEVLNAGVNGYSTFHYSRWAEHRLAGVDPDLLIVGLYVGNDNELDLEARVQVPVPGERWLTRSALGYALRDSVRERGWVARRARRQPMEPDLPDELLALAGKRQHELELKDQRRLWQHAMEHLASVRDHAAAAGVEFVVLLVPVHWELNIEHESDAHVFLRDRLAAIDVPVLTVLDALREVKDTCWLPYDRGHLSAAGHQVVADALAAALREGGFLDDD